MPQNTAHWSCMFLGQSEIEIRGHANPSPFSSFQFPVSCATVRRLRFSLHFSNFFFRVLLVNNYLSIGDRRRSTIGIRFRSSLWERDRKGGLTREACHSYHRPGKARSPTHDRPALWINVFFAKNQYESKIPPCSKLEKTRREPFRR